MRRRAFRALILSGLLAGCGAAAQDVAGRAELVGKFVWENPAGWFGGFSGLEVADDGIGFVALSDHGMVVRGSLIRDGGRITGTRAWKMHVLHDPDGFPLRPMNHDSEGLASAPGGGLYISFEGKAHVALYRNDDGPAEPIPVPAEFEAMQPNASLEALAIDAAGRLYTLPERSGRFDRPFPVYVWDGKRWTVPYHISRSDRFLVSGADFGPDGKLYILERDFTGIFGFRSRVRRFDLTPGAVMDGETVLQTRTGTWDNLEGLSVWRDETGGVRLTMISDDNYSRFQVTEFVEYRLPGLASGQPGG